MFKLKYLEYRNSGSVEEVSFEEYMDLVYFVASNKIKDDDVVSITLFDEEMDLNGLANKVMANIEAYKIAHDKSRDVDELNWEDEESEEEEDEQESDSEEDEDDDYSEECSIDPERLHDEVMRTLDAIFNS